MTDRWLLVGLGNPGKQYEGTRHNAGFQVVEAAGRRWDIAGKGEAKFQAIVGTGTVRLGGQGIPVVLAEPTTFMNLSGRSVGPLMQFYKVAPENLLVIYDDTALPLGKLRIRPGGSAGGHNGMKSIIQTLGGNQGFPRLRIGIGPPEGQKALANHVLERFASSELPVLDRVIEASVEAVEYLMTNGIEPAQTRYNGMDFVAGL